MLQKNREGRGCVREVAQSKAQHDLVGKREVKQHDVASEEHLSMMLQNYREGGAIRTSPTRISAMSLFICTQDELSREKYQTSKGIRNKTPPRFSSKSERTIGRSVAGPTIFSHSFPVTPNHAQVDRRIQNRCKTENIQKQKTVNIQNTKQKVVNKEELRNSHGECFKIGDHEFGRTRHDVPLSMIAFAYGVLVSFWPTGDAQK